MSFEQLGDWPVIWASATVFSADLPPLKRSFYSFTWVSNYNFQSHFWFAPIYARWYLHLFQQLEFFHRKFCTYFFLLLIKTQALFPFLKVVVLCLPAKLYKSLAKSLSRCAIQTIVFLSLEFEASFLNVLVSHFRTRLYRFLFYLGSRLYRFEW